MSSFKVIHIQDGDTFQVRPKWRWRETSGEWVRIAGIDAPEMMAFGGVVAMMNLKKLIDGKNVRLDSKAIDRGRLVADVEFFSDHHKTWLKITQKMIF